MKSHASKDRLKPKIVLGVAAHPDDLEFCAAGTVARWSKEGASVYYLILTDGSKGTSNRHISSSDLINVRRKEQKAAAKLLGVKDVFFLNYEDGKLANTIGLKRDITRVIRQIRPDVVVTMDPSMIYSLSQNYVNHPDHRAAGQAVLDAVFPMARDHLSFPELLSEGLEPHVVPTLLLINFENNNYFVDIGKYLDVKIKALQKHKSQLSSPQFTKSKILAMARACGEANGCECAEGFIKLEVTN